MNRNCPTIAFTHLTSLCTDATLYLVGSEAEALAVPIDQQGKWLPQRIDLDSHGEIMRIGVRRALIEGKFNRSEAEAEGKGKGKGKGKVGAHIAPAPCLARRKSPVTLYDEIPPTRSTHKYSPGHTPTGGSPLKEYPKNQNQSNLFIIEEEVDVVQAKSPPRRSVLRSVSSHNSLSDDLNYELGIPEGALNGFESIQLSTGKRKTVEINDRNIEDNCRLMLESRIEIRSYSLSSSSEGTTSDLLGRSVSILSAPIPYDPSVDLVSADLRVTPAVVAAIDRAWATPHSIGN